MNTITRLCIAGTALCLVAGMCACNDKSKNDEVKKLKKQIEELEEKIDEEKYNKKEKEASQNKAGENFNSAVADMNEKADQKTKAVQEEFQPAKKEIEMVTQTTISPQNQPETLSVVQQEFNKKYAALMKIKKDEPYKFDEEKLNFISYFSSVAQADGLTKKQLGQYNELAKEFGMEIETTEDTAAATETAAHDSDKQKSKQFKADYDKLSNYLNANANLTRRYSKPEKILDELDKQLGMMREFMDKWETFPKTKTEQKYYDNILRIYKKTQQSRDMYSM